MTFREPPSGGIGIERILQVEREFLNLVAAFHKEIRCESVGGVLFREEIIN